MGKSTKAIKVYTPELTAAKAAQSIAITLITHRYQGHMQLVTNSLIEDAVNRSMEAIDLFEHTRLNWSSDYRKIVSEIHTDVEVLRKIDEKK
jgi:hypothetical protein